MFQNHAIYAIFCTWDPKNTVNTDTFEPKSEKNAIHTRFFAHCVKNHGIYSVFCTWPFKNIGIYNIFAIFHVIIFQHKNCKNTVFNRVLCFEICKKMHQKLSKKPSPKAAFSDPWFFGEFPWVFWRFFDFPKIPKKCQNIDNMKDFSENSLFSKLETFKMQKCSEMQARTSFFKVTFKKYREGGGRRHRQHPG